MILRREGVALNSCISGFSFPSRFREGLFVLSPAAGRAAEINLADAEQELV
jgi:hypothetical protein